jgi:hypothetical protein
MSERSEQIIDTLSERSELTSRTAALALIGAPSRRIDRDVHQTMVHQ